MNGEHAVFAKAGWRLLPFMILLYLGCFIDRVNVGFAALSMNADLGFSPEIYGFGAGVFFWGYFLFEVPSNLILARVGARLWIFRIMLTWGAVSMLTALVSTSTQFYSVRFLLGLAEAGFFPGMVFYLTLWFPAAIRARFFALFLIAVPLSGVVGGPISGAILSLGDVGGLKDWQWLFVLEALPALVLSFAVLAWLPDGPERAPWLSASEKNIIAARLAAEPAPVHTSFLKLLADPRLWFAILPYFGLVIDTYGLNFWLPQIVKAMGFSNFETGLMVALPYLVSIAAMYLTARSSDARGERIWHTAIASAISAIGFAIAAFAPDNTARFIALTVASAGFYAAVGLYWTLPTTLLGGMAAAGGIGLINAVGNIGGFLGPVIMGWFTQTTGDYRSGLAALAGVTVVVAALTLVLGRLLPLRGDARVPN